MLTKKEEIINWLDQHEIENYILKPDVVYGWCVDVKGSVYLESKNLKGFPVKFDHVSGNFDCSYNEITSLEMAPIYVGNQFSCHHNRLVNLKYSPECVDFFCNNNELTTLSGMPKVISGIFDCSHNKLVTLEGGPRVVKGDFYCDHNQIIDLKGAPESKGDFFADNNHITNIDELPHISGKVYLESNRLPSQYQNIDNYEILKSLIEKEKLSQQIKSSKTSSICKL